eukprot:6857852-Lingulodinium_polyedra.AAC.1
MGLPFSSSNVAHAVTDGSKAASTENVEMDEEACPTRPRRLGCACFRSPRPLAATRTRARPGP